MINLKNNSSSSLNLLNRILLLAAAIALVLYMFPKHAKFQYEYTLDKPWSYSLLVAPYDFPIYKTAAELQQEKDSLLKNFSPYYKVDTIVVAEAVTRFTVDFDRIFERLQLRNYKLQETVKLKMRDDMLQIMSAILSNGVISLSEKNQLSINGTEKVNVIAGKFTRNVSIDQINTSRMTYQYLIDEFQKSASSWLGITDPTSFEVVNLNNYIQPNLSFDVQTSQNVKSSFLSHISITSGLFITGQRIVEKGQIITPEIKKIVDSYRVEHERRMGSIEKKIYLLLGQGILIGVLLAFVFLYLFFFRVDLYHNFKDIFFIVLCMIVIVFITVLARRINIWSYYLIPYAILPIMLRTFFDSRTALFVHIITMSIIAFMVPSGFQFLVMQVIAGMAVTFSLKNLDKRSQLVRASFIVALTYSVGFTALWLMTEGEILNISWYYFIYFLANALLLLLAYPVIYILEKTFKYLSDVTLMELGDTNHPLLRKLSEEAPGTFQHSIQVSNMVHGAARKIGANPLLGRVGTLYHDIGKTVKSFYFTENQSKGQSPHSVLGYEESARIVTGHVIEGVKLAQKHGLPRQIIDFITMHHGYGKAKYFYTMYKNEHPDEEIDDSVFSYPGPNPQTKETAILMMADAVEATSRSLSEYTDESIRKMVDKIIDAQMAEGYFRSAPITFRDVELIKESFVEKLTNVYHTRIAYPTEKKKA